MVKIIQICASESGVDDNLHLHGLDENGKLYYWGAKTTTGMQGKQTKTGWILLEDDINK